MRHHREAWTAVERQWLWRLRNTLGPAYHVDESPRMLLLSVMDPSATYETLRLCDRSLDTIEQYLPGVATADRTGKHVVLCFEDPGWLSRYMACYPDISEWAKGICIHAGLVHVAMESDSAGFAGTLVHELTHACLAHRDLPRWLSEAMAQRMARIVASRASQVRYQQFSDQGRQFWQGRLRDLHAFLGGTTFHGDRELAEWSYVLAEHLLERICQTVGRGLYGFLSNAKAADGGRAAAKEYLGRPLELILRHLITGEPQPDDIETLQKRYRGVEEQWVKDWW